MKQVIQRLAFLVLMIALAAGLINAQDPVAQYKFSGNVNDNTSFNNHLTVNGTKLTADAFGIARSAISFDGVQGAAHAAVQSHLNTPTATVSFWVNVSALPGQGEVYLLSFGGWQERYKVSLPAHGKVIWTTNGSGGISDMDAGNGNELVPGVWTHLAFSHDGTADKIYINGAKVAEKAVSGDLNNSSAVFGLGYDPIGNNNFFAGKMDEVMVFGTALSDADITALYTEQSKAPEFDNSKVASYSFSGSGKDDSDFQNHASSLNADYVTDRFGFGNKAIAVDGDGQITAANSSVLNSPAVSVAFWVKMKDLPGTGEYFLMSNGGWQERWKISLPSHGKPVWTTNHSGGISDMDSGDGNALEAGKWAHLVMVHDGSKDLIYKDGVLVAEKAVTGTLNPTSHPLGIGYDPIDNTNFAKASFDEVMIYNYALSSDAITALYTEQNTFPGAAPDLVASYDLNGNGLDGSVFANHAEAVGAVKSVANRHGLGSNAVEGAMVADQSAALMTDNTTISIWVKPNSFPGTGEVFILSNGGWQERWKVSLPSHGKPVFTTYASACCSDMDTKDPIALNAWTHLVFMHKDGMDYIYVNGQLANSKASPGGLHTTTHRLGIGFDPIDNGGFFDGATDDLKIFNRALSDTEIANLYTVENTALVIAGDLVANYTFEGNSWDDTDYQNHASSAVLGKDRFGRGNNAAVINGKNPVTASNSPQLNSAKTTVSFWANPRSLVAQGEAYLISFGGWQERFKISLPSNGKVVWTTNNTSGISDMDSGDGNVLGVNTWTHVVAVHDGTNDKIYFNGVKVAEKAVSGDLNNTTKDLGIGYDAVDNANIFDGSLDEVQIYNVALDDAAILALYEAQSALPLDIDEIAPTAPLDLMAMVEFNTVNLIWQPSEDNLIVAGYKIYIDGEVNRSVESTNALIDALLPLTTYEFGVSAFDGAGNESAITTITATTGADATPDTIAPSAPANLKASPSFASVLLSWDASTDNSKVAGYIVLLDGVFYDSLSATTLSVLVGGLNSDELYSFEVAAFDLAGNLSPYSEITVKTTQPLETAEPGLVAHYAFENNADDSTPYANHGQIGGNPKFETATHPQAGGGMNIVFDGDRDSILVPNGVQLLSDYTSVSFWIRVDGINTAVAEAYVLDFGHWDQRWKISLPQHLKIVFTTNSNNVQFPNFISDMDSGDGNEMVRNFWWFVTMVHDGTNDIIYVNGQRANIKPVIGKLNTTARPLGIGNNPIEGGQYFIGALDEVKIYNRALTAEEAEKLYNSGTVGIDDVQLISQYVSEIYPNPTAEIINVNHQLPDKQDVVVSIFDVAGKQVGRKLLTKTEVSLGRISMDVSTLHQGTYFMNFNYGGKNLGSLGFIKN